MTPYLPLCHSTKCCSDEFVTRRKPHYFNCKWLTCIHKTEPYLYTLPKRKDALQVLSSTRILSTLSET
uniref:Uncharacterized protein n=1 Tax=Physcomitrium patens TaxID=3218 RepID=A0A2K1L3D2_PHYPA|nr:hypothetical protein PHYPA_003331 [Physcomitrium patens]